MAVSRGNPLSIEVLAAVPTPEDLKDEIDSLIQRVRDVDTDLLGWLRRQAELVRLRMGIRDRKKASVPWKNSSDISVPLIDGIIRRWLPGIASLVLDANPVASFDAREVGDLEAARAAEPFFHYLFTELMDTTYPAVQLVNTIAWHGHAYTRQGWDYRTARQARIVSSDELFEGDIEEYIQTVSTRLTQTLQPGQPMPSPQEIVAQRLEEQYDLDRDDPAEGPMLLEAAEQLLQGAPYVRIVYRRTTRDRPRWDVINPINVIVPQDQDPEDSEFFCIIHQIFEDDLRALAIDGFLPQDRVDMLLATGRKDARPTGSGTSDNQREQIIDLMDRRAGKSTTQSERETGSYTLWEIYCRLDANGDGERERITLWYSPEHDLPLALLDYVFPFDSWNITYFPFEAARRPIDNRGLADMLKTFQRLVNAYHNMRIDAGQIMLAPVLTARLTGGNLKRTIKYHPGAIIPVQNPNDVQPLVHDMRILGQLLQEEQVNQRLAEAYVGVFDATLTNLQESRERRTAAEVNAIQGLSSNIFGLDAKIFQVAFSKVINQIWSIWLELGPAATYMRVMNEEPIEVRKADIGKNFDISASGTPANTNRSFQIATLERAMQVLFTPVVLESGLIDIAELVNQWLSHLDRNVARSVVRSPEDATAVQQIRQAGGIAAGSDQPAPAF